MKLKFFLFLSMVLLRTLLLSQSNVEISGQISYNGSSQTLFLDGATIYHENVTTSANCSTTSTFVTSNDPTNTCYVYFNSGTTNFYIQVYKNISNTIAKLAVTSADKTKLQNHILTTVPLTVWPEFLAADMNRDGSLDVSDMTLIQRIINSLDAGKFAFIPIYADQSVSGWHTAFFSNPLTVNVSGTMFDYPSYLGDFYNLFLSFPGSLMDVNIPSWASVCEGDVNGSGEGVFSFLHFNRLETRDSKETSTLPSHSENIITKALNRKPSHKEDQFFYENKKIDNKRRVSIYYKNNLAINGFQLNFKIRNLSHTAIVEVNPSLNLPSKETFNYSINKDKLKIIWYDDQSLDQIIKDDIPIFNIDILNQNDEIEVLENDEEPIYSLVSSYNSIDKKVESNFSTISKIKSDEKLKILRTSPIGGQISVDVDVIQNADYYIQICDQIGRVVQSEKIPLVQGINNLKINRPSRSGIHFVRIYNFKNNENIVKPIFIE